MKIAQKYSHMHGEEFLIVHHNDLYDEIREIIKSTNTDELKIKNSNQKAKSNKVHFSQKTVNRIFHERFRKKEWIEYRYDYYTTLNRKLMEKSLPLSTKEQKNFLSSHIGTDPIHSFLKTDYFKDKIALECKLRNYPHIAHDLFVKYVLFYTCGMANLGIEILPTKKMQTQMSSGIAYFEGEVYKVMRQGRNNPAVPLLILGIEP